MIREANKFDKEIIIEMLKCFRDEVKLFEHANNEKYINVLLDNILVGGGVIYLDEQKGMIVGIITPSIWDNNDLILNELAWYVKPQYRHTTVGYRLLKKYLDKAKDFKESNRIKYYTMGKLPSSPSLKYEKYGFKKMDENWIC